MTPVDARKLWCDALRSGEYKQTTGTLCRISKDEKSYCCLGVACDVYQKHVGDLVVQEVPLRIRFDEAISVLPAKVSQWLDITRYGRFVRKEGDKSAISDTTSEFSELTVQNDQAKLTFEQIATLIENREFTSAVKELAA